MKVRVCKVTGPLTSLVTSPRWIVARTERSSCDVSVNEFLYAGSQRAHHLHYKVDTTHLVHELHTICEQHATSGLHFVTLKQLRPLVLAGETFSLQRLEHICLFSGDLGMIRLRIVDVAKHLKRFFVPAHFVQVTRRFRDAEDNQNDKLSFISMISCFAGLEELTTAKMI